MDNRHKKLNNKVDLQKLLQECKSKWHWCAVAVVVCVCLGIIFLKLRTPIYETNASILIAQDDQSGSSEMMAQFSLGDMFGGYSSVDDEIAVIKSHSVFRETVKDLDLNVFYNVKKNFLQWTRKFNDSPIHISCDPSIPDTLRVGLLFEVEMDKVGKTDILVKCLKKEIAELNDVTLPVNVETPYGVFTLSKTENYLAGEPLDAEVTYFPYDLAAETYQKLINLFMPSKKANIIAVLMKSPNPKFSETVINTLISNYNKKGIHEKQLKENKTAMFIDERLKSLTTELDNAELAIEQFKRTRKISDVGAEASYLFSKSNALETQLISAETEFEILESTRSFISNPENKYSMIPYSAGAAEDLISGYNKTAMNRLMLMNNAKSNNVSIRILEEQLEALLKNIVATLDKSYETSLVRLNELRKQVRKSQSELGNIPAQEREYLNMKRQQSVKEQLYLFLLQRREETSLNIANSMPRGTIVDAAYTLNKPTGMSTRMILMISFVLGCCVVPGWLYLKKVMRTNIENKEEVEELSNVPILGEICQNKNADSLLVIKSGGSSSAAELFRLIRSNLQFILNNQDDKVVLLTSTVSGEGKSFVSINLAASFAMLGKRTLLVGMDVRNPKLSEYLGLHPTKGLTEYLSSNAISLDSIILKDPIMPNWDIITSGPVPPNPSELLASSRVDELFDSLRRMYDYIIIDSAPVGMVSDTFTLARISDATAYVCRANYTSIKDIDYVNTLYAESRLKKMALIVNGTESKSGYGYGYGQSSVTEK